MKFRLSFLLAATALACLSASGVPPAAYPGFSAAPLNPAVRAKLKASGRPVRVAFPNWVNQGKKFNPGGDVVPPLVTGAEQEILVVFVDFTTVPPGGPQTPLDLKTYFDPMLFGTKYDPPEYAAYEGHPTDRTLSNYYARNSYGAVQISTYDMPSHLGWANAGKPFDYYCKSDGVRTYGFGPFPNNAAGLVVDAIKAVDPYVDFSKYAVNGEVPNIFIVHRGGGAEWNGDGNLIWSHSSSLDWFFPGGYEVDGVRIKSYAMMPEVGGDTTGLYGAPESFPPTVGVYAHEYAHVLGLPDQYDYGYESEGTGIFSLMAGGSWNAYPNLPIFSGNSPAYLDAWSKYRLGFVTPVEVTNMTDVTLRPSELQPDLAKVVVPFSGGREYYLLENRQPIDFDLGLRQGAVHGLAIYHIDDSVLTRNYWRPNEAGNWKNFRSEGWMKAWTGETHYGISIIQADGQWHLEHGTGIGSAPDLYPGALGVTEFSSATVPNTSTYYFWPGAPAPFGWSGVKVTNIREAKGTISARVGIE